MCYSPATKSEVASCKTCDDGISVVVRGLISLIVLATLLAMGMMVYRFEIGGRWKGLVNGCCRNGRGGAQEGLVQLEPHCQDQNHLCVLQIATRSLASMRLTCRPLCVSSSNRARHSSPLASTSSRWLSCFGWGDDYVGVSGFGWPRRWSLSVILVTSAGLLPVARRLTLTRLITYALPGTLRAFFIIYPLVTAGAFDAYPCYSFADEDVDERRWLKIDVEVECDSRARVHQMEREGCAHPVPDRPAGLDRLTPDGGAEGHPSPARHLSTATAFLHKDYEPHMFWWELVEMGRHYSGRRHDHRSRVFSPMLQLILGTLVSAIFLFVQLIASPYENQSDDYLAATASFSILVFFLCLGYKEASAFALAGIKQEHARSAERLRRRHELAHCLPLVSIFGSLDDA